MPIAEIDEMVTRGELPKSNKKQFKAEPLVFTGLPEPLSGRAPEHVLSVWVAPFESKEGIYWQASHIHVVVKEGRWAV